MAKFAIFALTALVPMSAVWAQETIVLRDGTQFSGRMTNATDNNISFRDQSGEIRRFNVSEVDSIRFNNNNSYTGYNGNNQQPDSLRSETPRSEQGNGNSDGAFSGRETRANNSRIEGSQREMVMPSGTEIAVRTNEPINAQDSTQGRSYSAQVTQDIADINGNLLVPRGSEAQLVVRRTGGNNLALDLQSISIRDQRYTVNADSIVEQGNSRDGIGENKRTAEYVGGAAVLGTLLGAIAGGGKGAAIGALAGGAAGAGAEVVTRGNQVKVPAETVLNFRLDRPVTLNAVR